MNNLKPNRRWFRIRTLLIAALVGALADKFVVGVAMTMASIMDVFS